MSKNHVIDNLSQPPSNLTRWLSIRGLRGNPFEKWNAENDLDLPSYFVDIVSFNEFSQLETPSIIFAQRGCGKTAQKQMVASECRPLQNGSARLCISYSFNGFERILNRVNYEIEQIRPQHHVEALLYLGVNALQKEISRDTRIRKILENEGLLNEWKAYILHFAPSLASQHQTNDPANLDGLSSIELLQGFSSILQKLGIETCVVLIDGLDEFSYTSETSKAIKFLAPLLGTLSIIECPGFAFKFFLPKELESVVFSCTWFRQDRIQIFAIKWKPSDFLNLIENRLAYFSKRGSKYSDIAELCDDELGTIIDRELFFVAGELPRNVLILADKLLRVHCDNNPLAESIKLESWQKVKDWWITNNDKTQSRERSSILSEDSITSKTHSQKQTQHHPVLVIDETRGTVTLGESEIRNKLEGKIYTMLLFLYKHRGEVCNKNMIVENVWPDVKDGEYVTDQAIAANISRLRKILNEDAPNIKYIETIKGRTRSEGGYRLLPGGYEKW
ncbi:MAG: hypothetical protein MHPDNHAH_03424 [Anaerolineales bacterium]|nr:hypothetical protein [Anaerolineales bacterium]